MPTILIVDDDAFTRSVLETIFVQDPAFAKLGVEVVTAADGEQGLMLYREHKPAAVIIDLLMPKLDGFGLCQAIRATPGGEAPVLAVTSGVYRDNAIVQRLRTEYDAGFFAKPYQLKEMTRHVAESLASGRGRPPSAPFIATIGGETEDDADALRPDEPAIGEIGERPLPAVLLDLLDAEATGRLLVRRGRVSKTIELVLGHPVSIQSSLRDETLGQLLLSAGIISDAQHRQALERAAREQIRIGEALIALGALTPEQLAGHLTAQLRHKLIGALRWPVGAWRYEPQPTSGPVARGSAIDGLVTIITGLRDTVDLARPQGHLVALEGRALTLTHRGRQLLEPLQRHVAPRLAELWRDGATPLDLINAGLDRAELLAVLDILALTGGLQPARADEPVRPSESSDLSVRDLSEHSQLSRLPRSPEQETHSDELYETLFDEATDPLPIGTEPIELTDPGLGVPSEIDDNDSAVIDVSKIGTQSAEAAADRENRETVRARRMLLEEYLRIQGLDHYDVLHVPRDADDATISAAAVERRSKYSLDWFARFDLGRDYAKLEHLHAAYGEATRVLLDPQSRAVFDSGEASETERAGKAPPLEAEIAFSVGEELLAGGNTEAALGKLQAAVALAPDDATYLATLGWTHYLRGGRAAAAADEARRFLNDALARNPDSSVAHAYKGIIGAELGDDDTEARFHLERALDGEPTRGDALAAMEAMWERNGELRPLEKLYRRLIYRTAGRDSTVELLLWRKLAELYRTQLDEPESARIAYESAARLAPGDSGLQAVLSDLASGAPGRFYERSEVLRTHWRRDPSSPGPGLELMRAAEQAARPDALYMAASALVARGLASEQADEIYHRYRPRFLLRAQRQIDAKVWQRLRHPDDSQALGALFSLIADAVAPEMPLSLDDLEVDETMLVEEDALPPGFVKVRAYVAHLLGVPEPVVYVRTDFGRQIHVGAVNPPVLLCGDQTLAAPERSELGYRLGRAMTYLLPGRALGGSRPSRFLKHAVLAAWQLATPAASGPVDPELAQLQARLTTLPPARQEAVRRIIASITGRTRSLNLSRWVRGLARTADRTGLLLCGDLPAAVRFAADSSGSTEGGELIDFAISSAHLALREQLGLSIDV